MRQRDWDVSHPAFTLRTDREPEPRRGTRCVGAGTVGAAVRRAGRA